MLLCDHGIRISDQVWLKCLVSLELGETNEISIFKTSVLGASRTRQIIFFFFFGRLASLSMYSNWLVNHCQTSVCDPIFVYCFPDQLTSFLVKIFFLNSLCHSVRFWFPWKHPVHLVCAFIFLVGLEIEPMGALLLSYIPSTFYFWFWDGGLNLAILLPQVSESLGLRTMPFLMFNILLNYRTHSKYMK